jgi:hypothetical protein
MASTGSAPILSFCMTGRDDDYTPDFVYRLETTLEYLAMSVRESGHCGRVEAIVSDWGGARALRDVVRLSTEACELTRFVTVPREVVLAVQDGRDYFSTSRGYNVGIRRASGSFRALCGADILIPAHTVDVLVKRLESNQEILGVRPDASLMFCTRKRVPWDVVARQPSVCEWQRFLHANAWMLEKDDCFAPGFLSGNASVIMMHANLWQEFGGVCERMTGWGWSDVELTLRVTCLYPWIDVTALGTEVFDLAHPAGGDGRSVAMRAPNRYEVNRGPNLNGPAWGLGDLTLDVLPAVPRARPARPQVRSEISETITTAERRVRETLGALLQNSSWAFDLFTDHDELFLALACVTAARLQTPSAFIDVGASKACAAAATLSEHRWVDYIAADSSWLGSCTGIGHPTRLGYLLYSQAVGFKGRGTFVPTVESLPTFLSRTRFDGEPLIIFRREAFEEDATAAATLESLSALLSQNGVLLATGLSRRPGCLDRISPNLEVRPVPDGDLCFVFDRSSRTGHELASHADALRKLADSLAEALGEHPVRRAWSSLHRSPASGRRLRAALLPRGHYGRRALTFVKHLLDEGPEVVAILDGDQLDAASAAPKANALATDHDSIDCILMMADPESEKLGAPDLSIYDEHCRIVDFGALMQSSASQQRFPQPFLDRIVEAPHGQTPVLCGYGLYGRALHEYLKTQDARRFRYDRLVVWDNFKDSTELAALGFQTYLPDDHDEWPADYLFAITPLNNEGMLEQLTALLVRHLIRHGKRRIVVAGSDANARQALCMLEGYSPSAAGIELCVWIDQADDRTVLPWKRWTLDEQAFPSEDTIVLLPAIESAGTRQQLEGLGGRPGDSFIDNILWCQRPA